MMASHKTSWPRRRPSTPSAFATLCVAASPLQSFSAPSFVARSETCVDGRLRGHDGESRGALILRFTLRAA